MVHLLLVRFTLSMEFNEPHMNRYRTGSLQAYPNETAPHPRHMAILVTDDPFLNELVINLGDEEIGARPTNTFPFEPR